MKLKEVLKKIYSKESKTALQAQRAAQEIAFAPVVFQISRLMIKFGILDMLSHEKKGLTQATIVSKTQLSTYAVQVLLEASLSIGTVLIKEDNYVLSKTGWFLLNDAMAKANLNFNHDVNYLGLFKLEESLLQAKPAGLKVFGEWPTIYEGLSKLPPEVQESWFGFDHFYSDNSFQQALEVVFLDQPRSLLDVGGNTGRWAKQCVKFNDAVEVTIMDLPQQIAMMREQTAEMPEKDRIHGYPMNLLDNTQAFPTGFEAIWMSQFLDCFAEEEVIHILTRAAKSMGSTTRLYIMETFWDRQEYETAAYCLNLTSPYFTALANGNSKMFHSDDLIRCIETAGLFVEKIHDSLGLGHSIVVCKKK